MTLKLLTGHVLSNETPLGIRPTGVLDVRVHIDRERVSHTSDTNVLVERIVVAVFRQDADIAFAIRHLVLTGGVVSNIGQLAGANVYQFAGLPNNSENLAGFACGADAIAVASALPMSEIPGFEVANAVDADTGLGVQVLMGQEQSGYYNVTATLLFGAAVGRATSLNRLTTA